MEQNKCSALPAVKPVGGAFTLFWKIRLFCRLNIGDNGIEVVRGGQSVGIAHGYFISGLDVFVLFTLCFIQWEDVRFLALFRNNGNHKAFVFLYNSRYSTFAALGISCGIGAGISSTGFVPGGCAGGSFRLCRCSRGSRFFFR